MTGDIRDHRHTDLFQRVARLAPTGIQLAG